MNRWAEYDAKTLVAPCVVQHDIVRDEHLIWVWDGVKIHGPLSRSSYNEAQACADVVAMASVVPPVRVDPQQQRITELEAKVTSLTDERAVLRANVEAMELTIGGMVPAPEIG